MMTSPGTGPFLPAVFILFLLTASGCATAPSFPPVDNPVAAWHERRAALAPIDAWEIQGRLALRAADEGWQTSLHWVRAQQNHKIDLSGPLGRGHVRLEIDEHGAQLRDAGNRTYYARDAQRLLYRATGWSVPLDGLNYWLLGIPDPDAPKQFELDAQGRLAVLEQRGWRVQFKEYRSAGAIDLPRKLFLRRNVAPPAGQNKTLEVRVVINHWGIRLLEARE